jgi:hypothetical protein
MLLLS